MKEKQTFSTIFILFVVMLVSLPFLTTFQDILTRILMSFQGYRVLQNIVVPYEIRIVASFLTLLHIPVAANNLFIQFTKNGQTQVVYIIWNCVGWQSFLIFLITLISGFSGHFTIRSKVEAFSIGVVGTYLINIIRLILVMLMYYFTGRGIGLVFHDYFSSVLSIAWLFFFWWFAYGFVLETKLTQKL